MRRAVLWFLSFFNLAWLVKVADWVLRATGLATLPQDVKTLFGLLTVPVLSLVMVALGLFGAGFLIWDSWKPSQRHAQSRRAEGATNSIGPDMPIRELFFHVRPDVLEDNNWVIVGNGILDQLATNKLRAWGRRDLVDVGELSGSHKSYSHIPLAPIRAEFWADALFTDNFFAEGHEHYVHAIAKAGSGKREAYRDVRFNTTEVLNHWPKPASKKQTKQAKRDEDWIFAGAVIAAGLLIFVGINLLEPSGSGQGFPPSKLVEAYWRPLSTKQIEQLTEALLKVNRGKMVIGCNFAECRMLARDFYELFRRLGWDVPPPIGQNIDAFVEGITISPQTKEATQIATAIKEATGNNVSVEGAKIQNQDEPIRLNIGAKPFVQ